MLETLSLRLRVFLFFAFVAGGAVLAVVGALFLGYRQLGNADALSAFITSGAQAMTSARTGQNALRVFEAEHLMPC